MAEYRGPSEGAGMTDYLREDSQVWCDTRHSCFSILLFSTLIESYYLILLHTILLFHPVIHYCCLFVHAHFESVIPNCTVSINKQQDTL